MGPEWTHDSRPPPGALVFTQRALGPREPVRDVVVATRRWLAACCASAAMKRGMSRYPETAGEFLALAFPDLSDISDDAVLSVNALMAEERLLGHTEHEVPGFRGPDEWYRGAAPR